MNSVLKLEIKYQYVYHFAPLLFPKQQTFSFE